MIHVNLDGIRIFHLFFSLQIHLNDEEFLQRFKMTYADYASKPAWRQKELKKMAKLF